MQTWRGRPCLERGNMELAVTMWQGWLDSNQRMRESKSLALPLGYTPVSAGKRRGPEQKLRPSRLKCGVGKGIRTLDTRNHNPVL